MQLVLDRHEKILSNWAIRAVVCAAPDIDIRNLLVETPLASTDFANTLELFLEVILAEEIYRIFEAFVVHGEPLDNIFLKDLRGPDTEHRGFF